MIRSSLVVSCVLAACGRIDFDALAVLDAGGDAATDGPSATDLVLYYPFDGMYTDAIAGRLAAGCGTCAFNTGHVAFAVQLFGNGCMAVAPEPAFQLAEYTISVWIQPMTAAPGTVISKPHMPGSSDKNSFELFVDGNVVFKTYPGGVTDDYLSGGSYTPGTWYHVAASYDGTTKRLYLGGTQINAAAAAPTVYDDSVLLIGCDVDSGTTIAPFDGLIDELRLYSRALTLSEIQALAQ